MAIWKLVAFGAFAVAAVIACGSDSDGGKKGGAGGSGTGGSSAGGECDPTGMGMGADCPDLVSCVETKCKTQYEKCLGANYLQGDPSGGTCEDYMRCVLGCNKGGTCDQSCLQGCTSKIDSACMGCLVSDIGSCVSSSCSAETQACAGTGSGGSGGTTAGGKTCDDFQACCNSLGGADKDQCLMLYDGVKGGGDAACNTAIQAYTASGKC